MTTKANPSKLSQTAQTPSAVESKTPIQPAKSEPMPQAAKPSATQAKPAAKVKAVAKTATLKPAAAKPASKKPKAVTTPKVKAASAKATPIKASSTKSTPALATALKTAGTPSVSKPVQSKTKMERDSFTMPKEEYAQIAALKKRLENLARPTKKSELLRAGLKVLSALDDTTLLNSLNSLAAIKTGRPKH